ncbi:DUF2851 family protein [Bacteroidota bacterium]
MNEEFLHFVWKHQLFQKHKLIGDNGERIEIISTGTHNFDSGPDFFNVRLKINNITWAGNVEIHVNSNDWYKHKHHENESFDNVILHVVQNHNGEVRNSKGKRIPTAELKFENSIVEKSEELKKSEDWIQCEKHIHKINSFIFESWISRLTVERLERKTKEILEELEKNNSNWEETFYHQLGRNFGLKTNSLPFGLLVKNTPLRIAGKHKNDLFQLEALFFGNSGLLEKNIVSDTYYQNLKKEYRFLQKKYKLNPLKASLWKFMRLRPVNFPTIRIAQFAAFIYKSTHMFSKLLHLDSYEEVTSLFNVQASEYWNTHYTFGNETPKTIKKIGKSSINLIFINTLIPFLFAYGVFHKLDHFKEKGINFLHLIPKENNSLIRKWNDLGIDSKNAFMTQGLIELKNNYCSKMKCLYCQLGIKFITNNF